MRKAKDISRKTVNFFMLSKQKIVKLEETVIY